MDPTNVNFNILIVEDEAPIALLERKALERAGFQVEEAHEGEHAIEILAENHISLVVLDYYLPDMTGGDVIAAMGHRIPKVPVVIVTGYDDPELAARMHRAGVADYLVKDAELEFLQKLPQTISRVLGSPS